MHKQIQLSITFFNIKRGKRTGWKGSEVLDVALGALPIRGNCSGFYVEGVLGIRLQLGQEIVVGRVVLNTHIIDSPTRIYIYGVKLCTKKTKSMGSFR